MTAEWEACVLAPDKVTYILLTGSVNTSSTSGFQTGGFPQVLLIPLAMVGAAGQEVGGERESVSCCRGL